MENNWVIITGGGKGSRMNSDLPKQFLPLNHKPVIIHTIEAFYKAIPNLKIIVVLPEMWMDKFKKEAIIHHISEDCVLVKGGATRFLSIKHGLAKIPDEKGVVGIHDAVRPLVSKEVILQAYAAAADKGTAVPVIDLKDSIRKIDKSTSAAEDRMQYKLVQTPQCFQIELIKKAYDHASKDDYSDDAAVVEEAGAKIYLTEGSPENIKITTPSDLVIAEALQKNLI